MKVLRKFNKIENVLTAIMDKIFETKSSFLCEMLHYGKNSIAIFQEFFASIEKKFILGGRLTTRLTIL